IFIVAVVAAAVEGPPSGDRFRATGLAVYGLFLVISTLWLALRVVPPWGSGLHTLRGGTLYPVNLLDYVPLLWAVFLLSWHRFDVRELRLVLWAIVATVPVHAL